MKKSSWLIGLLVIGFLSEVALAQMTTWFQWTYLPQKQMDEIVGESSGETALNHVIEMGGYVRDRKPDEYSGTFREAQYVLNYLKEHGVKDAEIARFPGGDAWDGVRGELWEVEPIRQKLASYTDLRAVQRGLERRPGGLRDSVALRWKEQRSGHQEGARHPVGPADGSRPNRSIPGDPEAGGIGRVLSREVGQGDRVNMDRSRCAPLSRSKPVSGKR